ncbi:YuiB family protein [Paenactinomyces guangxiensis]|uniref:YuiB family protein n=1 Tax=Paenactinomyces guangxiensis TaxID=1490290 RepID=UPI001C6920E0|nr:YuiB family protein [Paenactinomyces guangxiensis]
MSQPLIVAAVTEISLPQLIISIPLFFVLTFGIGFILNMILKTTWLPLILYFGIVIYLLFSLTSPHVTDITVLLSGLAGAVGGGWTIKTLRAKGYRMF